MADQGSVKRGAEDESGAPSSKKIKNEGKNYKEETLSNLQYRDMPYQQQLVLKKEEVHKITNPFNSMFVKKYPQLKSWYSMFLDKSFRIDNIIPCKKTKHYRNKCEFTIGFNPETQKISAGPRISDDEQGKVQVGPCNEDLVHLTPAMIEIAQDFTNNFLEKWNYLEEKCPFLNLFIRRNKKADHMLIFILEEENKEKLKEYKNELVKYYTEDYKLGHSIKSMYLQSKPANCTKRDYELDFLHAWGEEHLVDDILGIKLIVTPGIFFPINTFAAEASYQKIVDLCNIKKGGTVIIDLWCGCGALSVLLAKTAGFVVAVDPSKWNVRKGQFMAKSNNTRNIEFIISQPVDALKKIWNRLQETYEDVVIVADPPTLAKMTELGHILEDIPTLTRFVYIHSNHKLHAAKNMMNLTAASLIPTRVIPVDVSPHSVRVEFIFLLRKIDPYTYQPEPVRLPSLVPTGPAPLLGRPGPVPDPDWVSEIERRAYEMGLAKGMAAAPVPRDEYEYGGWERTRDFDGYDGFGADDFEMGGFRGGRSAASGFGGKPPGGFGGKPPGGFGGKPAGGFGGKPAGGFGGKPAGGFGGKPASGFGGKPAGGFGGKSAGGFGGGRGGADSFVAKTFESKKSFSGGFGSSGFGKSGFGGDSFGSSGFGKSGFGGSGFGKSGFGGYGGGYSAPGGKGRGRGGRL